MEGEEGVPPNHSGVQNPSGEPDSPKNYGTFDNHVISFEEKVAEAVARIMEEKEENKRKQLVEEKKAEELKEQEAKRQKEIEEKEHKEKLDRLKLQILANRIKAENLKVIGFPLWLIGILLFALGLKYFYLSYTSWIMVPIGLILWVPILYSSWCQEGLNETLQRIDHYNQEIKSSEICNMLWINRPKCMESYYKREWQKWVDRHVPDYQNYLEIERTNLSSN